MPHVLSVILSVLLVAIFAGTIIVILTDSRNVSAKVAWLLLVAVFPVVGVILYVLVGLNFRRPGYSQRNHEKFHETVEAYDSAWLRSEAFGTGALEKVDPRYRELAALARKGKSSTVSEGNEVTIFTDGKIKLESLMEDIRQAKKYIHMEYFYFRKGETGDKFKALLKQKAQEGVKVRFIYENIANFDIRPRYYNEMKSAGVEVIRFTQTFRSLFSLIFKLNYRDHRKIVVIDGEVGYTGGMNISDNYYSQWRDTHSRITGHAVAGLQLYFLDAYITSGGKMDTPFEDLFPQASAAPAPAGGALVQLVPGDPDTPWPVFSMGIEWVLFHARDYVWIQTPYFGPPAPVLEAVKAAALKGVDIRLMLPRKADIVVNTLVNRSYYRELLEAGVKLYIKGGRFIHSKTFVSDDYLSEVGSANLDYRSLELSYELNLFMYDEALALQSKAIFEADMQECSLLTLDAWMSEPWYKRTFYGLFRLFAPLV